MKKGFTLIELVIVIAILGILAAVALPKFVDIVTDANAGATRAGLGAIRSVIALKYSQLVAQNNTQPYSFSITTGDFFDGRLPENKVNANNTAIVSLTAVPTATTSGANGWWYVTTTSTTGTDAGVAGVYKGSYSGDTSAW